MPSGSNNKNHAGGNPQKLNLLSAMLGFMVLLLAVDGRDGTWRGWKPSEQITASFFYPKGEHAVCRKVDWVWKQTKS